MMYATTLPTLHIDLPFFKLEMLLVHRHASLISLQLFLQLLLSVLFHFAFETFLFFVFELLL